MQILIKRWIPLAVAVALIADASTTSAAPTPEPTITQEIVAEQPAPIRLAVAGDSITSWHNYSFPTPVGHFDPVAWLYWITTQRDDIELVGGYSHAGWTASQIAAAMVPVDCDVLVVMVSTNDLGWTPPAQIEESINTIVQKSGAPAVIIAAVPPFVTPLGMRGQSASVDMNAALADFAAGQGWGWVDPWVAVSTPDRLDWLPGASFDGVHPEYQSAHIAADAIADAIHAYLDRFSK